ncbi:hypothetical protein BC477_12070 [Clavibacter michiganensis subsp. michiganensis]|uniref:Uncharacterized protein n=1 Tax=Clavibacter michiganensis subsp. michiganensis TaxID=33013 RepID=A0A251XIC6_CLAMM|nr:hypothetical protein BC477_12070 [Clavibacter michiganensis subsp. michiganensis]OUE02532.1 hypothetical protein CMMCAS07_10980 [Clavibacter michiganensis subsp. michiganensis]
MLGVAEGQPAYWSGYEDGARFADRTPFFAFVQTRWLEGERGPANGPVLRPFLADGTEVDIIQRQVGGVSASAQCPYEMPVLRADDGHAAEEHLECVVYAVPVGQELAELRWHDVPRTVLETPDPATTRSSRRPSSGRSTPSRRPPPRPGDDASWTHPVARAGTVEDREPTAPDPRRAPDRGRAPRS